MPVNTPLYYRQGICIAGGAVGYKMKLQPTIAQSLTEADFMGAPNFGKLIRFIRSMIVMSGPGIPQDTATIPYEDNDTCTMMENTGKPIDQTYKAYIWSSNTMSYANGLNMT